MEDATAPSQRQKRRRGVSEDDEAGDTGAARGSPRLAAGIDVVAEEKQQETLFIQEEEEAAAAFMEEPDGTPHHALPEISFFNVCGGATTAARSLFPADRDAVDVALTLGCNGPLVARREDTVDATLRLGLGPPSAAPDVAARGENHDGDGSLQLHLHGVPFSASPAAGPKLDPPLICSPLPFAADPYHHVPPVTTPEDSASPENGGGSVVVVPDDASNSFVPTGNDGFVVEFVVTDDATDRPSTVLDVNQPCSSEFPPDDIVGDVHERPGQETAAEHPHQSSTPYTFI